MSFIPLSRRNSTHDSATLMTRSPMAFPSPKCQPFGSDPNDLILEAVGSVGAGHEARTVGVCMNLCGNSLMRFFLICPREYRFPLVFVYLLGASHNIHKG